MAAEDVLQDEGAISMISSDSQAMGRIGEVVSRTWRTASKMRELRGPLPEEKPGNDNARVKRYMSKYTINPCVSFGQPSQERFSSCDVRRYSAIVHGISHLVGDIAVGKLADLCIWDPASFGARPFHVIKGGMVAWAQMGDANAVRCSTPLAWQNAQSLSQSIPTVQPVIGRPSWGSLPRAASFLSLAFVSEISISLGITPSYGLSKRLEPVKNCRNISKKDMKHNDRTPTMKVDPESYRVEADGVHCTVEPAERLPLSQGYFIF